MSKELAKIKSVLFGVAVGDALGVPVEFNDRQTISKNPVTDMIGYGTYNLPAGTWSDDSSLTFCLAEALTKDFDLNAIGQNFINWVHHQYWTPRGRVFDIGIGTRQAIDRIAKGEKPEFAGGSKDIDNGNGSLMRILPLLFYIKDKPINERYEITRQVSSITHGHIRSVIACFYYLEFAKQIWEGKDKFEIYRNLQTEFTNYLIKEVNNVLTNRKRHRGQYPVGVSYHKASGKFSATCSIGGKSHHLGVYLTVEEAFSVYKETKEAYVKELAIKWKDVIDERAYIALVSFTVNIND